jgi:hypothetical protein
MKFFDNVSGTQKLMLIMFLVIVALLVFLPDVGERVWQLVRESSAWVLDALNTGE